MLSANVYNMPTGQTSLNFVTVGNPGNAADPSTGYGAVPYTYQIGEYDVTTAQYCQFLNAVATTSDPYGLYNSYMATDVPTVAITQSGTAGNYSYSVTGSYSQGVNCPIFDVTWGDAARFCNWLQNGQPTGAEGPGTTETGAYTLNGATTDAALMAITRNAGAVDFIPSENEWYKAAYYDPSNASYWLYPTQSDTAPSNVLSATGTNNANYAFPDHTIYLTPVGTFAASPGPYGTYDMGGDIYQWNEATMYGSCRGFRGGDAYRNLPDYLASSSRDGYFPSVEDCGIGFRVARTDQRPSVPSITTPSGTQSGNVTISYTLTDAESDMCGILVQYSSDGGTTWNTATAASGGNGTTGLTSGSNGTSHTFVWASGSDIVNANNSNVEIRITPSDAGVAGTAGTTGAFTVNNYMVPMVTGLSPLVGPLAGGTSVTITGTNLAGATAVNFGATAVTTFTSDTGTQIVLNSPAGNAGTVDVTVVTPGGTSATSPADRFSYVFDAIGLYDPATYTFYLKNSNSPGNADVRLRL